MHSLVKRILSREIQRPSAEKVWQIPGAMELPMPWPFPLRSTPLEVQATSYLAASERRVSFSNKDMFSVIFKAITFSFSIKYMEALAKEVVVEACPVLMIYQIRAALFIKRQMPHNACKGH